MKDVEYNDACELPKLIHREKDPTGPFQKLNFHKNNELLNCTR